jgi:hypothetical protein
MKVLLDGSNQNKTTLASIYIYMTNQANYLAVAHIYGPMQVPCKYVPQGVNENYCYHHLPS